MRGTLSCVLLCASAMTLWGQQPAKDPISWQPSLRAGWTQARDLDRLMVIFVTSEDCHFCDLLKQSTWANAQVSSLVVKNFVPIRLKVSEHRKVVSQLGVSSYPTIIIANPKGKVLDHREGFQSATAMNEFLTKYRQTRQVSTRNVQ